MFAKLALQSLLDRKGSVLLSLMAMTVSIFVLLGVEHIRHQAKQSFSNTVSGVDLIVGSRTGSLNLLLYSVFRIGAPSNNIRWQTYQTIINNKNVNWAIPISLGDSHKGHRVLGTTEDYFRYFNYGNQHALSFSEGKAFSQVFDLVLGSEVAKKLAYKLGDKLTLAHGIAANSFSQHKESPFTVVGILAPTGTPVDQTLHVSLQGIEAIHLGWQAGMASHKSAALQAEAINRQLEPKSITAFMLGLNSKMATFRFQREINNYNNDPLLAILPGIALSELWQMMSIVEGTLLLVTILVFIAACLGVSAMLLSSIRERKQEIHLLRVIGAPPYLLFLLIELEALIITLLGILFATTLLALALYFSQQELVSKFGLSIPVNPFTHNSLMLILMLIVTSLIVAALPSFSSYTQAKNQI